MVEGFTSRVFGKYINEGITMLTEGYRPQLLKMWPKNRMPVGPLAVSDEVNLQLMLSIMGEDRI
jgi:3-hydroxyacyl-CoA dehydrogenase/enoyl-CoA hydratase/3-hydroxybutyryl-CoA epimerase